MGVAMKWRDAVKAAIMHGPLPPDVCHSRRAVSVATRNAIVATGGLHGASAAEAQNREASVHARTRRGEAVVLGLPRLSSASTATHTLTAFAERSSWCGSFSGRGTRHVPQVARRRRTQC